MNLFIGKNLPNVLYLLTKLTLGPVKVEVHIGVQRLGSGRILPFVNKRQLLDEPAEFVPSTIQRFCKLAAEEIRQSALNQARGAQTTAVQIA